MPPEPPAADATRELDQIPLGSLRSTFAPPHWLRDAGRTSWLIVGFVLLIAGVVWLLGLTATITGPVVLGGVIAAVTTPIVNWLGRHGVKRAWAAVIVLLLIVAIALALVLLVLGGLSSQSDSINQSLNHALDQIESWLSSLGIEQGDVKSSLQTSTSDTGGTLVNGVMSAISGLASLATFLLFSTFTTFFFLKDGPVIRAWVERHLGVPAPVARLVTTDTLTALRGYFLGVTIVAAFNATVIGLAALVLGVPLAGTIAIVNFVAAYIPYIGAWTAGIFTVLLTLASQGTDAAVIMTIVVLLANGILQQVVQPLAYGAALSLNPLVVLIVTISAGCVFGMVGLVLSAPLTSAAVKITAEIAAARRRIEAETPALVDGAAPG